MQTSTTSSITSSITDISIVQTVHQTRYVPVPAGVWRSSSNELSSSSVDPLPLHCTLSALVQHSHSIVYITTEHSSQVYSSAAAPDDLIADLTQQPCQSVLCVVVLAE
jgi:hypothetical protein